MAPRANYDIKIILFVIYSICMTLTGGAPTLDVRMLRIILNLGG